MFKQQYKKQIKKNPPLISKPTGGPKSKSNNENIENTKNKATVLLWLWIEPN